MDGNKKRQPVSYRRFRAEPLLAEGLLGVERGGGELERKVADAFFRIAEEQGAIADRRAAREGERAGRQAALAGAPGVDVAGGQAPRIAAAAGDEIAQSKQLLRDFEGFRSKPYYDVNALRTGYGSDQVTLPDGTVKPVGAGTRVDRAGAERDLDRRVRIFISGARTKVGADAWDALPANVKAGLGSVAYNYGSLPSSVAAAVKAGDVEGIAQAVEKLKSNPKRRAEEAAHIRAAAGAAPDVDPSVRAPAITASGGGYRPSGRDTIYGRAFDAAGTKTYLQELSAEVESTTAQVYERFKDDPTMMSVAFSDLRDEMLRSHVFDEIRAEFDISFGRRVDSYMLQAQRDMEKRAEQENRAAFLDRTTTLETERARKLAAFDPANPAAGDELAAMQAQLDDHYDAAVLHGILDPDDAAVAKQRSRAAGAAGYYLAQADAKDADGVRDLRKQMKADFAAGELDGIDADGWTTLETKLERLEDQKRLDDARAEKALRARGDAFVDLAAKGFEVDQAELGRFILDAKTAKDGPAVVRRTLETVRVAGAIRDMKLADAETMARDMRARLPERPDADRVAAVETAEKMVAATRTALATDPVSHGETMRIVEVSPPLYEAQSPEAMQAAMLDRIDKAETVAAHFGIRPRYLKAGEAKALDALVRSDPEKGAAVAAAIVAGAGNRASAVLAEFGQSVPLIAGAGAILAGGGDATAAADAIAGALKDPSGRAWPVVNAEIRNGGYSAHIGGALAMQPGDDRRIRETGSNIARKRIAEAGVEPKSDEARAIFNRALDEAAGAVFDGDVRYGGFSTVGDGWFADGFRVLVPNTIRADRFGDVLAAIRPADIERDRVRPVNAAGEAFPTAMLAQMRPLAVRTRDGRTGYAFARNDPAGEDPQFVRGSDGEIYVLDVAGLAPKLAARVPGAFRGY